MQWKKFFGVALMSALMAAVLVGCGEDQTHTHSFDKWSITKVAGCVDNGVQSRECKECGYLDTASLPAVGHTTVKDSMVKATCTEDGLSEGSHCSVCGETLVAQNPISAFGHAALVDYAVKATCTTDGLTEGTHCYICGIVITAQEVIPATGHQYDEGKVVTPANCIQIGTMRYSCAFCDTSYLDTYSTTEHTVVTDAALPATCLNDGWTEGSHCSVCMEVFVEQQFLPALGHQIVSDPAVAETCTTVGYTEGSHCGVCQEILVAQEVIPALGHTIQETVLQEATCKEPGLKEYLCLTCGETNQENFDMPQYTDKDLYDAAVRYMVEIITYDKNGKICGGGLGFVLSQDGQILINYQTIAGAYRAQVMVNGKAYDVQLVLAYNEAMDLAVVKVEAEDLTPAQFCAEPVMVEEVVYALAVARGMSNTYTPGVVVGELLQLGDVLFVQHDAVITASNSGGPLLNIYGEVIGINSFALSQAHGQNVAVFVSQLEQLDYSRPVTLVQLYQQNTSAYQKLVDAILANGTKYDEGLVIVYGSHSTTDYLYVYELVYQSATGKIWLTQTNTSANGQKVETTIWLSGEAGLQDFSCGFAINDREYNRISGTLDASTFTIASTLQYTEYNGMVGYETTMMSLYNPNMIRTLDWLSAYLTRVADISMADMGFLVYEN